MTSENMPENFEGILKTIYSSFSDSTYTMALKSAEENVSKKFIDDIQQDIVNDDIDDACYKSSQLQKGINIIALSSEGFSFNEDFLDFLKNYHIFEANIENKIESIEGSVCVSDKTGSVMTVIYRYLLSGEKINFDYSREYTFHYPKKVFTNFEDIIIAYHKINSFIYGNMEF